MKKFLAMALAAVMVLALAACGSKNDTADDTGDAQDAQGGETQKLIVGFDAEFPPFGFIAADGTYDGFDLAMAKELCARLGWEYEAVAIDWNSKDAELSSGTINCIWNGFTYTGRENDYTFSDPYVDNSIVMVVKADSGITSRPVLDSMQPSRRTFFSPSFTANGFVAGFGATALAGRFTDLASSGADSSGAGSPRWCTWTRISDRIGSSSAGA